MKSTPRPRLLSSNRPFTALALALAGLPLSAAFAVDYDFVPVTGTAAWNNDANWTTLPLDDASFPNLAGDFANLIKDYTGNTVVTLNQDITLGRLDLGDITNAATPQTLTVSSGTGTNTLIFDATAGNAKLNLQNTTTTNTSAATVTISASISMLDNLDLTNGRNQFTFTGPTLNLGANVLTIGGNGTHASLNFGADNQAAQGVITGTGSVVVNFSSVGAAVALFGPSTFSGGTTLQQGLIVAAVNSVGVDGGVTSGSLGTGTLTIQGSDALFSSRVIRATGNGARTVGNSIAANSDFTIGQGSVATALTLAGGVTLGGDRVIGVEGGSGGHTISGAISDGGNGYDLIKTGAAALRLSGASTYTGATIVRNNAIVLLTDALPGVAGPLGNAVSAVQLGDNSAGANNNNIAFRVGADGVNVARDILVTNQNGTGVMNLGNTGEFGATFSGNITLQRTVALSPLGATKLVNVTGLISGTGGLLKIDQGPARVSNAGNSFTGATTVRRGTLLVGGDVGISTDSPLGNAASAILLADANTLAGEVATLSIDGAFTISRNVTVNNNGSTLTLSASNAAASTATYAGGVTLNKGVTLANATAGATTRFSGIITDGAGTLGVTINGPGIVEFSGASAHSYDGLTTVTAGTLLLNSPAAGGVIVGDGNTATPDVLINGGTLLFGADNQLASTALVQFSSGTLDLAGRAQTIFDLDYTGGAIVNAGGLIITNGTDLFLFDGGSVAVPTVIGRKLIYAGSTSGASVTGDLALDADPVHEFAINNGAAAVDTEILGVISNQTSASTITKRGNGVLKLLAAAGNTFGGAGQTVTIEGGALAVTQDNQLGDAANSLTFTGGALRFDAAFATGRTLNVTASGGGFEVPNGVTIAISNAGQINGDGTFTKSGAGTLEITADQSGTWTGGAVALAGGILRISNLNQLGAVGNDVTFQGGTLELLTGFTADPARIFTLAAGGGTLNIASNQIVSIPTAGGMTGNSVLTKSGGGTLVLGAANTGFTAGAGVKIVAGSVELQNAQSLGNTVKAAVELSGGALVLRNDAATAFANPLLVSADSKVISDVATAGSPGVAHTLGALTLNAVALTADAGSNVTGGAPAITFSSTTLTGNATLNANGAAQVSTGGIGLGANRLTLGGSGTINLNGVIAGGPGAGQLAIEKNGAGTVISSAAASTFTGVVAVNAGIYRLMGSAALGNAANVIRLNGGALQSSSAAPAYALRFNGGSLVPVAADRAWPAVAGSSPSIFFDADTTFSLVDGVTPATDRSIDLGTATGGVVTSAGPVDITVIANATNTAAIKRLRFMNTTDSGSVSGTLSIEPNAIAQIRSGGGTQNALGSGVLFRLNTGINLGDTDNSGRLEIISDVDANFGNDVVVLGDSTINPQRILTSQTNGRTLTLNDLAIGSHTLVVDDAGGNNYSLVFDGVTTLSGSPTFHTVNAVALSAVTDGAGTFGLTKSGGSTLTVNGGSYDGSTLVNAGTLSLGAAAILNATSSLAVNGGTLSLNAFNQTVAALTLGGTASVTVNGSGILSSSGVTVQPATGQTVTVSAPLASSTPVSKIGAGTMSLAVANALAGDLNITSGVVNQTVPNGFSAANDVLVDGGRIDFAGRSGVLGDVTLKGPGNVNALGLLTGTNATGLVVAEITGTLTVNGDASSAGTSVTVNSGGQGANLTASKVVIQSGTTVGGTGAIFVGGNAPGSSLTIGAGGLELSNIESGAYNAIFVSSSGGTSKVNLGGNVKFTGNANPSPVSITGAVSGSGGVLDLGSATRTFDIGDGAADTDVFVGLKIVGDGGITKTGAGTLEFGNTALPHAYTGATTINAGTLIVGSNMSTSATTVNAGGTLIVNAGGSTGPVNLSGGSLRGAGGSVASLTAAAGIVAPGLSAGTLASGDFLLGPASTLQMEIGGYFVGSEQDQVQVVGSVAAGAQLQLSVINGFVPVENDTFYLIINDDIDPVLATFAGLDEGAFFTAGGFNWTITYQANGDFGGVPNDIAVIAVPEPGSAVLLLAGLGAFAGARRRRRS